MKKAIIHCDSPFCCPTHFSTYLHCKIIKRYSSEEFISLVDVSAICDYKRTYKDINIKEDKRGALSLYWCQGRIGTIYII